MSRWAQRWVQAAAVLSMMLVATTMVHAESRRVAIVGTDAGLADVIAGSLSPWGLSVIVVEPSARPATVHEMLAQAKSLAARHGAAIVLGVATDAGHPALWVYDDATGQATVRLSVARRPTMTRPLRR